MLRALIACPGTACLSDPGADVPLPEADYDWYVAEIQPMLAEGCANPACHGNIERPLQLYAERRHRLDPLNTYLEVPLSEDELRWNFDRVRAFLLDVERAEDSLLLLKPLAPEAGGVVHEGGIRFQHPQDHDYQILYAWSADALAGKGYGEIP